jgi:hypothetical protein
LDYCLVVAARLVPGNEHECPILYELVDGFVQAAGRGIMKVLIVDRGLLDGANLGRLKTDYHIDTVIPLKTNMDAYQDVMGLTRLVWGCLEVCYTGSCLAPIARPRLELPQAPCAGKATKLRTTLREAGVVSHERKAQLLKVTAGGLNPLGFGGSFPHRSIGNLLLCSESPLFSGEYRGAPTGPLAS